MAIIKQDYGLLGGGILDPQYVGQLCKYANQSSNFTVDTTKTYVLTTHMRMTGTDDRADVYVISKGTVEKIHSAPAGGYSTVTINGDTLTCTGTNSTYYTGFILIQLD